jgi:hypothetical protein
MAESHAPPLQMDQFFVYLRDHLLIDKNVGTHTIKRVPAISSGQTTLLSARFRFCPNRESPSDTYCGNEECIRARRRSIAISLRSAWMRILEKANRRLQPLSECHEDCDKSRQTANKNQGSSKSCVARWLQLFS